MIDLLSLRVTADFQDKIQDDRVTVEDIQDSVENVLIQAGLGGIEGKITSAPAKHLSVLCNQMVNFLGIMQNEWAGAQAFSSFDTYLAPFVKADKLSYREVKKWIENIRTAKKKWIW